MVLDLAQSIAAWPGSPWAAYDDPWTLTLEAPRAIADVIAGLGDGYRVDGDVAVHETATIESQAVVKGPCIIGPGCFVAHNAYLRGGLWLSERVIVGPSCEIKTAFLFPDSKIAHLSFVGDSVLGSGVNIEAGAIVANYRNERDEKAICVRHAGTVIETGIEKFGALIGDGVKVGANAVIAPGAILDRGSIVPRLALVDQSPAATACTD